jgi:magnesium transporter
MRFPEKKTLLRSLQSGNDSRIIQILSEMSTVEIAAMLNSPSRMDISRIFRLMPQKRMFKVFRYLDNDTRFELLKSLPLKLSTAILNRLSPDDRTSLFEYIPESQKKKWLNLLSEKEREISTSLLSYPEDSVGRSMNVEFLAVQRQWNVAQVMAYIRKYGKDIESIDYIYVVDKGGILQGDVNLKNLILSTMDRNIMDICEPAVVSLNELEDQAEAVKIFKDTRRLSLPVTNNRRELIGIVTIDDLIHIMEENNTRDIHQIGGSESFAEQYFKIPLLRML